MRKPNILIIEWDEMRADALGCAGSPFVRTPHLDRLAQEGVRFTDHHSISPLCAPARHAFLTSRCPHVNHAICGGMRLRADIPTLPHILKEAGYRTAVVGKLHHTPRSETYGFEEAWITDGGVRPDGNAYTDWLKEHGQEGLSKPQPDAAHWERHNRGVRIGWGRDGRDARWTEPSFITEKGCEFLSGRHDDPFLLYLSYKPPHSPHFVPEPFASWELPGIPDRPQTSEMERSGKPRLLEEDVLRLGLEKLSDDEWTDMRTHYFRFIAWMDALLGRLWDTMDAQGLWENTIVLFTSDHGVLLGEFGYYGKLYNYEPSTRIPLLMRVPGAEGGSAANVTCDTLDVLPTLLDYAGIPAPAGMQGDSLRPWVEGNRQDSREFYLELTTVQRPKDAPRSLHLYRRGLRSFPWKITYHRSRLHGRWDWMDEWELYHLGDDPNERSNLAGDPNHAAKFEEMRMRLLHAILEKDGDYDASECRE